MIELDQTAQDVLRVISPGHTQDLKKDLVKIIEWDNAESHALEDIAGALIDALDTARKLAVEYLQITNQKDGIGSNK